jgi:iron complex transport system substrate-binding protein
VPPFRRPLLALLSLVLLCSAVPGGVHAARLEAQDDRGVVVHLPQPPQRVVTLLPSLTETVCALGACGRLVGTDRYSNWPASVRALPKAGGLDDANVERIVSLKPDLVLAAGSARIIGRLESLGITVAALEPKNHADTQRVLRAVGLLLGQPGADTLWAAIQRDTDAAAARMPAALKGQRVYMEVDASPYAAGPTSFIGETLQRLGLDNVVGPELGPFPKLNPEFVVRARPDIVIGSTREVNEMPKRPGWAGLSAFKRGKVCRFSSEQFDLLVRPGPRLGEAAQLLTDCLVRLPP